MNTPVRRLAFLGLLAASCSLRNANAGDPLSGTWVLNRASSHYGGGAEERREETMRCAGSSDAVSCTIDSTRADGRQLTGRFHARYDGSLSSATGIPEVDQVRISKVGASAAEATFLYHGRPVFGYRATKSPDGKRLTIVSVDPETRRALSSVVVYDAAGGR
jgi:hypothetical protein